MTYSESSEHGRALKVPTPKRDVRVVIIATAPEAVVAFLSRQITFLLGQGFDVYTITSPGIQQLLGQNKLDGVMHEVPMVRTISPFSDIVALIKLWRLLSRIRPEIVQTRTPKAGLLGMMAAWLARVPIRIYTLDGLPILTQRFWVRLVLAVTDRLACALATEVLCVSRSVRRFMIASGFCRPNKARVLGGGSLQGIDTDRFSPSAHGSADRASVRTEYAIPQDALLIGYIGRLIPDKGIAELVTSWNIVREQFREARLLLCGYVERVHPIAPSLMEKLRSDPRVHFSEGRVADMPRIYAALDICVLPTYREGLSTVAVESGAMQVPIVATRVPGCIDVVRHGVTGLLVQPKNPQALAQALQLLLCSPKLREQMGIAARKLVSKRFSEARISQLLLEEYHGLLQEHRQVDSRKVHSTVSVGLGPGSPARQSHELDDPGSR